MDFYEAIAGDYDVIVNADARRQSAERIAQWVTEDLHAHRVLDAACGTGLHVRALTQHGAEVVAADISKAMLQEARARSGNADEHVRWVHAPMQEVSAEVQGPFDAILCLGNSLPHLLTDEDLDATLSGFASLLTGEAAAVLQLLNYQRILTRGERIVGVTRKGDSEYVRFYDFLPELVSFNILELTWRNDECEHRLHQTRLRPFRAEELCEACGRAGLDRVDLYEGPSLKPFDPAASDVLMLVARPGR